MTGIRQKIEEIETKLAVYAVKYVDSLPHRDDFKKFLEENPSFLSYPFDGTRIVQAYLEIALYVSMRSYTDTLFGIHNTDKELGSFIRTNQHLIELPDVYLDGIMSFSPLSHPPTPRWQGKAANFIVFNEEFCSQENVNFFMRLIESRLKDIQLITDWIRMSSSRKSKVLSAHKSMTFPLGEIDIKILQVHLLKDRKGKDIIRFFIPPNTMAEMTPAEAGLAHKRNEKPIGSWDTLRKLAIAKGKNTELKPGEVSRLNKQLMKILCTENRPILNAGGKIYHANFECKFVQ